jgi:hypothetical protein
MDMSQKNLAALPRETTLEPRLPSPQTPSPLRAGTEIYDQLQRTLQSPPPALNQPPVTLFQTSVPQPVIASPPQQSGFLQQLFGTANANQPPATQAPAQPQLPMNPMMNLISLPAAVLNSVMGSVITFFRGGERRAELKENRDEIAQRFQAEAQEKALFSLGKVQGSSGAQLQSGNK